MIFSNNKKNNYLCDTNLMKLNILILFLSLSLTAKSQMIDFMVGASTSHFLGDLGGKPFKGTRDFQDIDFKSTRYSVTTGLRFNLNKTFAIRTNLIYARISGNDKFTDNKERRGRNLNFYSHIYEGNATFEISIAKTRNKQGVWYVFGGIGYFMFNPKTKLNGQVYELQKYGTEGQFAVAGKSPYKLSSICFPHGVGYKWSISRTSYLSVELNLRKTQTDYIDDVSTNFVDRNLLIAAKGPEAAALADRNISTIPGFSDPGTIRGNPRNNDTYFFINFSFNKVLGSGKGGNGFGNSRGRGRNRGKGKCFEF